MRWTPAPLVLSGLMLALSGCAVSNTQLASSGGNGTVALYQAGQLVHWQAQHVNWAHPTNADAMPLSKTLWTAGHRVPEFHCYFMDDSGEPTRITLLAVQMAIRHRIGTGRVAQLLPQSAIQSGSDDGAFGERLFADAIWRISGGSRPRIEALLKEAVNHDANCLTRERKHIAARYALLRQSMVPARDLEGRPGVIMVDPNDPNMRRVTRNLATSLQQQHQHVNAVIGIYGFIAEDLSQRLGGSLQVAAREPTPPRELPQAAPHISAPTPMPLPKETARAVPPRREASVAIPASARVAVDLAPLQREAAETLAALQLAKSMCLDKASRECA